MKHSKGPRKCSYDSSQVLVHFDLKLEIRVACDGIGTVLSHIMLDGSEKPVGFMSCTLNGKYSQIEKEALACIMGVTRFHSFLCGHHFTLQTDHKPLLILFNKNKAVPQQAANHIQKWAWRLGIIQVQHTPCPQEVIILVQICESSWCSDVDVQLLGRKGNNGLEIFRTACKC